MYRFLAKSLTVASLVLLAGACGPMGKLSKKDKEDLINKGDKPLKDLQGEDKKKVEQLLMNYLAGDFDHENFHKSYGMLSHPDKFGGGEAKCKNAVKEHNDSIKKNNPEEMSKYLKTKEKKVKEHFADVTMKEFVTCAEKLSEVSKYFAENICSVASSSKTRGEDSPAPAPGTDKPKAEADKPKSDDKPKNDDATTKFLEGVAKKFSDNQEEGNKCHTLMRNFGAFWRNLSREDAVTVGEEKGGAPMAGEGKEKPKAVPAGVEKK